MHLLLCDVRDFIMSEVGLGGILCTHQRWWRELTFILVQWNVQCKVPLFLLFTLSYYHLSLSLLIVDTRECLPCIACTTFMRTWSIKVLIISSCIITSFQPTNPSIHPSVTHSLTADNITLWDDIIEMCNTEQTPYTRVYYLSIVCTISNECKPCTII